MTTTAQKVLRFKVPAMDCPVEVGEIKEALKKYPSVTEAAFDVMNRTVELTTALTERSGAWLDFFKKMDMPAELVEETVKGRVRTLTLYVEAMDCPVEAGEIREALTEHPLVAALNFDLMKRHVAIALTEDTSAADEFLACFEKLGMPAVVVSDELPAEGFIVKLYVEAMDCPVEAAEIKEALKDNETVLDIACDTMNRVVTLTLSEGRSDITAILATFKAINMPAEVVNDTQGAAETVYVIDNMKTDADVEAVLKVLGLDASVDKRLKSLTVVTQSQQSLALLKRLIAAGWHAKIRQVKEASAENREAKLPWGRLGAALVLAFLAEFVDLGVIPAPESWGIWSMAVPAAAAILLAGFGTIKKGLLSLVRGVFNITTLMAVEVIGAVILGSWSEAAMVMALYEIGEAIEGLSMTRAKKAIRSLLNVAPTEVETFVDNTWVKVPIASVPAGTVYRVEPGERAALDGVILEGTGSMDESMITGESLPVQKTEGSKVWAGALALESTLTIRATAAARDSMSSRIIRAVEAAEQKKAPLQRFVDKFAARYTPAVFGLSLAVMIVGALVTGDWMTWIYRGLVILVIACPCAIVISTPVTIVSALALAAQRGILVKGGVYLEEGRNLKHVALDKTGTITRGEPQFESLALTGTADEKTVWQLAASLAAMSSHPVSRAITVAAEARGTETSVVKNFKALPGYGTEGRVNGSLVRLTNLRWLREKKLAVPVVETAFEKAHAAGETAVAVSDMFGVVGVFAVADTLKDGAVEALAAMKKAGLTPWLLTGDNRRAAETIGHRVGLADANIKAELLPEQKLSTVDALENEAPTAMVGDGINDAPALSRARIGFAMGIKGADSAIEAADVALMDDDVGKIAWFKHLSELTHRTMVQNIAFALLVKAVFALLAIAGLASMWMAVFADTGVTLLVVAWGMRLMKAGSTVDRLAA